MGRAVYIGGFGNGKKSAEGVAEALADHYDDVRLKAPGIHDEVVIRLMATLQQAGIEQRP